MADPQHHIARIGAPARFSPLLHLLREIGRGLAGERRIGRPYPLARVPVASGTGGQTARGIAKAIQHRPLACGRCAFGFGFGFEGHRRIVQRDGQSFPRIQLPRNPRHLRMITSSVRVRFKLPFEVPGIEVRQPGNTSPVASSFQPMTCEAGVRGPGAGAAERYDPPILAEAIERSRLPGAATDQRCYRQEQRRGALQHFFGLTARRKAGFHCLMLSLAVAACKPPPEDRQPMPLGDPAKGLLAIERVGCGSCHTIPGLRWPQGTVGPALHGLAERALIAGRLPNRPDVLAAYIRNAPAMVPGSAMPAMPVSEGEAHDIAAYLYEKEAQ